MNGINEAQNFLGLMYERGEYVKKNPGEAVRWYEMAAKNGNTDAMNKLAVISYKAGDTQRASELWHKAAEKGHEKSQLNLAAMYEEQNNIDEALKFYRLAADNGSELALNALMRLCFKQ